MAAVSWLAHSHPDQKVMFSMLRRSCFSQTSNRVDPNPRNMNLEFVQESKSCEDVCTVMFKICIFNLWLQVRITSFSGKTKANMLTATFISDFLLLLLLFDYAVCSELKYKMNGRYFIFFFKPKLFLVTSKIWRKQVGLSSMYSLLKLERKYKVSGIT